MGKLTISMAIFNSYFDITKRVGSHFNLRPLVFVTPFDLSAPDPTVVLLDDQAFFT